MTTAASDWIDIIEASYRIDRDESDWLQGVLAATQPKLDHGRGIYAITYDFAANRGPTVRHMASIELPEGTTTLPEILGRCQHGTLEAATMCGTASHTMGPGFEALTGVDKFEHRGVKDTLGINVRDPSSFGCLLAGLLPEADSLSRAETSRWKKITAHIAAGYRLQRARQAAPIKPVAVDAIVSVDGKIEHAEGDAKDKRAREELRAAVLDIEASRRKNLDTDDVVEMRKGLISARWTLLEQFETGGHRYFVARENAAIQQAPTLTDRERQVLGYAALGHSDKLIAYDLGVAWSTVRVLIARAGAKLGTKKREQTVRAFLAMVRAQKNDERT